MATTPVLSQAEPLVSTVTDVYTVPASRRASVRVSVTNRGASSLLYRLSIAPLGAADATSQYFVYDESLGANSSGNSPEFALSATDVVRAYTDTATLVVTVNGIEQDA